MNDSDSPGTDPLVVRTDSGWIRGTREEKVRSWRGVPFGASTAGARRFRAAEPVPSWDGVRDCTEFGAVAPQPTYSWTDRIDGDEDCLHLDVVRPDTDKQLPVVVYIHGGSFIVGSSHMLMLRGFQLAEQMDVVYISINFRLGALGYLDLRSLDGECSANPAVTDQLLALQWVKKNIAAFGGDPDNITLMGESAGGAAVLTLMAVPQAEGLFHRAIAQSPPIAMIHSRRQSTFWARELVNRLALPRATTIDTLREEPFADIVRAGQSMMWRAGELRRLNSCYAPTVDGELIPDHPFEVFKQGKQHQVPLLLGTNSDEASFSKYILQRSSARARAGHRLLASFDHEHAPEVVAAYGGSHARADFAALLADALFWAPTVRIAEKHSRTQPTWMYRFDFAPAALRWLGLGAMHSLELSNIFGDASASRLKMLTTMGNSSDMENLTVTMQQHWAAFMHEGRPLDSWPLYDAAHDRKTLIFDVEPHVVEDPYAERREAWADYDMREWGNGSTDLLDRLGYAALSFE